MDFAHQVATSVITVVVEVMLCFLTIDPSLFLSPWRSLFCVLNNGTIGVIN